MAPDVNKPSHHLTPLVAEQPTSSSSLSTTNAPSQEPKFPSPILKQAFDSAPSTSSTFQKQTLDLPSVPQISSPGDPHSSGLDSKIPHSPKIRAPVKAQGWASVIRGSPLPAKNGRRVTAEELERLQQVFSDRVVILPDKLSEARQRWNCKKREEVEEVDE